VIADEDGVVVWPGARIEELLERARNRMDADAVRLARIRAGEGL
jgi:regulator of RNase E activity RraA